MKIINTNHNNQGKTAGKIYINNKHKKAFTLVELIIVITILAILATIAFISFQNYVGSARDGNKITTLSSIEKGLTLYQLKTLNYPDPDNVYGTGSYSGALLTQVGYVGDSLSKKINMNKTPKDPLKDDRYNYGISGNKSYYQLGTALEDTKTSFIPQTYANSYSSKVVGNYKGLYVFSTGGLSYIINLPSLIFTNTGSQNFEDNSNPNFVINNGLNLVKPYHKDNTEEITSTLERLTKIGGINLTVETFPTDWNTLSGTLSQSLGYSKDDIGREIYGEKYFTDKNNLPGPPPAPIVYANCDLNGTTITHNTSLTTYQTTNVSYGNTCISELRTCNDGTLSGSFIYETCSVDGATGSFTLSNTNVSFGNNVNITNNCSTAPTSYTSSNTLVASISGTTITTLTAGITTITPVGGACENNEGKILTVTTPICTNFTYNGWGACQPNNTQTRTVLTSTPNGCTGGTPVLSQSCTYTPPQWKDIPGTSCNNDDYVFSTGGTTYYRWAGCNSVLGTGMEWSGNNCYNYAGVLATCTPVQMASTAKEESWNSTSGTVDNIWGKLYTHTQATSGACPTGWHLPTDAEWTVLETYLNGGTVCRTLNDWQCPLLGWLNNASKDSSNNIIQALKLPLAGHRDTGVTFSNRGGRAYLWSSTTSARRFDSGYDSVYRYSYGASNGFSVRCVKD